MAHPRRVVPGATYLVTRRCAQRTFRLRPSAKTNAIFLYSLAFAAERSGVTIHAVCVMSNHHHIVVTDQKGLLPIFLRELHRLTANAMNALQGERENLWAAQPCNAVLLTTREDVEDKIAYAVANPVAAGLVRRPEEWPGVLLWGNSQHEVTRPHVYFKKEGACPEVLTLTIEHPSGPGIDDEKVQRDAWRRRLTNLIAAKLASAHRAFADAKRLFLGRRGVLAASFRRKAIAYEPRISRFPTFAAISKDVRDALRQVERTFRKRYGDAFERWRSGQRSERFPLGTWGMFVVHGASVADT